MFNRVHAAEQERIAQVELDDQRARSNLRATSALEQGSGFGQRLAPRIRRIVAIAQIEPGHGTFACVREQIEQRVLLVREAARLTGERDLDHAVAGFAQNACVASKLVLTGEAARERLPLISDVLRHYGQRKSEGPRS